MSDRFVIVSSAPWHVGLHARLSHRTGKSFDLITKRADLTVHKLKTLCAQYVFFPHWSHRIARDIYEQFECIVFHMTDLPFGRGGSPLQNLITRGIYETKISAFRCVEELDAGPIYMKRSLTLYGSAEEIYLRASDLIEEMIVEIIQKAPKPIPQAGEPVTFQRRTPEQGNIAKAKSLQEVFDLIRMLDAESYPHAFIEVGSFRIEFTRASRKAEHVVADVRITKIKPAG